MAAQWEGHCCSPEKGQGVWKGRAWDQLRWAVDTGGARRLGSWEDEGRCRAETGVAWAGWLVITSSSGTSRSDHSTNS